MTCETQKIVSSLSPSFLVLPPRYIWQIEQLFTWSLCLSFFYQNLFYIGNSNIILKTISSHRFVYFIKDLSGFLLKLCILLQLQSLLCTDCSRHIGLLSFFFIHKTFAALAQLYSVICISNLFQCSINTILMLI